MTAIRKHIHECRARGFVITRAVFTAVAALCSALVLRWIAGVMVLTLPMDSIAAAVAQEIIRLSSVHFWPAAGVATFGGAASFYHDLRKPLEDGKLDFSKFTFHNAFGHMVVAQFAGLMAYLGAVSYGLAVPLGLVGCGLAGWGGGALVTSVNGIFVTWLQAKASK